LQQKLVTEMLKSAGGWAFWFPLNNLSLLWPIDAKLGVWEAYIKRQHGIATQMSEAAWDCYPDVCDQGYGHCC
jgi:hypothetical protein